MAENFCISEIKKAPCGARMQEGILSLMQMARTAWAKIGRLNNL